MRLALLVYKRARYRKHYDVAYFLNGSLRSLLSSCLTSKIYGTGSRNSYFPRRANSTTVNVAYYAIFA